MQFKVELHDYSDRTTTWMFTVSVRSHQQQVLLKDSYHPGPSSLGSIQKSEMENQFFVFNFLTK